MKKNKLFENIDSLEVGSDGEDIFITDENDKTEYLDYDLYLEDYISDICKETGAQEYEKFYTWANPKIKGVSIYDNDLCFDEYIVQKIHDQLDYIVESKNEDLY